MDICLSGSRRKTIHLTAQEIAAKVCFAYNIDDTTLRSQSQQRIASEARAVVGWLARELGCATLSDVGKFVNRDVGSISSSVRRLTDRMQEVPGLADRVRSLKTLFEKAT